MTTNPEIPFRTYLSIPQPDEAGPLEVPLYPTPDSGNGFTLDLAGIVEAARYMRRQAANPSGPVTVHFRPETPEIPETPPTYAFADDRVSVDTSRRTVTIDGKEIEPPPHQYSLIALLASKPDFVWPRQTIANRIWNGTNSNVLGVTICKVRKTLGPNLAPAIVCRPTVGYMALSTLRR